MIVVGALVLHARRRREQGAREALGSAEQNESVEGAAVLTATAVSGRTLAGLTACTTRLQSCRVQRGDATPPGMRVDSRNHTRLRNRNGRAARLTIDRIWVSR